jgi:hypothetical protein
MSAPLQGRLGVLLGAIVVWCCLGVAAAEPVKAREAAILARVLSYELTLDERAGEAIGIAVVYKAGNAISEGNADSWYQALTSLGALRIKGRRVFVLKLAHDPKALAATVDREGVDVILASRGLEGELDAIASLARSRRVLTAADSVDYLKRSSTVCVTQEGDKPKIYISLNNAEQERIRFSSNLLKLTTIVRP